MVRGRKPSKLKQATDTKLDGAYADLQAIPGDEFGGRLTQEDLIAAARSETARTNTGVSNQNVGTFVAQDFARETEKQKEPGNALGSTQQNVVLPEGTNTQIALELIKQNYGYVVRSRF